MKPFTKDEMIRVAEASGIYCSEQVSEFKVHGDEVSVIVFHNGATFEYNIYTHGYAAYRKGNLAKVSNILAVADTIKEILKEREA